MRLRIRTLAAPVAAAALLSACAGDGALLTEAGESGPVAVTGPGCVDFGPPPPLGTVWGAPVGQPVNTLVHVEAGVRVFTATALPGPVYNLARVENPPVPFGGGQTVRLDNIALRFDFTGGGTIPNNVEFEFLDLAAGAVENLGVNGVAPYVGPMAGAPAVVGGRPVSVATAAVPGGIRGRVKVGPGGVRQLLVAGQQGFWIDRVCFYP